MQPASGPYTRYKAQMLSALNCVYAHADCISRARLAIVSDAVQSSIHLILRQDARPPHEFKVTMYCIYLYLDLPCVNIITGMVGGLSTRVSCIHAHCGHIYADLFRL